MNSSVNDALVVVDRGRSQPEIHANLAFFGLLVDIAQLHRGHGLEPKHLPMRRDLAQPLDAGVLVLRVPAKRRGRASSIRSVASFTGSASRPSLNPRPPGPTAGPGLGERTLLDQTVADRPQEAPQFLTSVIGTALPAPGRPATWHGRPRPRARSRRRSPCAHAGRRLAPPAPRPCRPAAGSGSSPRLCGPDS